MMNTSGNSGLSTATTENSGHVEPEGLVASGDRRHTSANECDLVYNGNLSRTGGVSSYVRAGCNVLLDLRKLLRSGWMSGEGAPEAFEVEVNLRSALADIQ